MDKTRRNGKTLKIKFGWCMRSWASSPLLLCETSVFFQTGIFAISIVEIVSFLSTFHLAAILFMVIWCYC